jgi:hypothetical protein
LNKITKIKFFIMTVTRGKGKTPPPPPLKKYFFVKLKLELN